MLSNCKCTVWSSAVRISFSRRDHRFRWSEGGSVGFSKIMDHDPICWMLWHHDGFFQTTAGVRSDRGHLIYLNRLRFHWSIRQILFTSVPLYYFDLKSDWLPCFPFAFGSSPEDLLFLYLLFVPIEYHGNFHFSRRNVPQIRTSDFVQSTDFRPAPPICRWQARWACVMMGVLGRFSALLSCPGPDMEMTPDRASWSGVISVRSWVRSLDNLAFCWIDRAFWFWLESLPQHSCSSAYDRDWHLCKTEDWGKPSRQVSLPYLVSPFFVPSGYHFFAGFTRRDFVQITSA